MRLLRFLKLGVSDWIYRILKNVFISRHKKKDRLTKNLNTHLAHKEDVKCHEGVSRLWVRSIRL